MSVFSYISYVAVPEHSGFSFFPINFLLNGY